MSLSSLTGTEASAIASILKEPADKFGNDTTVELLWAMKAHHHAETYYKLLLCVSAKKTLRLTKIDNDIYDKFRSEFAEMKVDELDVEFVKSTQGKEQWREFCNQFSGQVEDWNMATLLRIDAAGDISETNTILVPRIQFLAIEIARNREGFNDSVLRIQSSSTSQPEPSRSLTS